MKSLLSTNRGYFAIGVEGVSKQVNLGNLLRSAHAFGASFAFTIGADPRAMWTRANTSKSEGHIPFYHWQTLDELRLPTGCRLVGIELVEDATELPSFAHPLQAAYVLGPERGALSGDLIAKCHHIVRIPTLFSLNLATAGAVVMYDRLRCLGRHAPRPVAEGAELVPLPPHVQGKPLKRRRQP